MPVIHFHYNIPVPWFRERTALKRSVVNLFKKEKSSLHSLSIIFVSDKELLQMNKRFLNHNTYTDIITFNLGYGNDIQGELYISVDRVKDNAERFMVSWSKELRRVIFHGCLHLCGYNDKTEQDTKIIRKKEEEYLLRFIQRGG